MIQSFLLTIFIFIIVHLLGYVNISEFVSSIGNQHFSEYSLLISDIISSSITYNGNQGFEEFLFFDFLKKEMHIFRELAENESSKATSNFEKKNM
jgi:hypothetical protein